MHPQFKTCCTCPQPPGYDPEVDDPLPKYKTKCACPSISYTCVSQSKTATLCGFEEYTDPGNEVAPSTPPKKYRKKSSTITDYAYNFPRECRDFVAENKTPGFDIISNCVTGRTVELVESGLREETYDDNCGYSLMTVSAEFEWSNYQCDGEGGSYLASTDTSMRSIDHASSSNFDDFINLECSNYDGLRRAEAINAAQAIKRFAASFSQFGPGPCLGNCRYDDYIVTTNLSEEDTESAALARATASTGPACSSIYQLRTDTFTFTVCTVQYTLTAQNLKPGVSYSGCVRIQRRQAYSGTVPPEANTEWEDVEPDTFTGITATPENTTAGVTTIDSNVDLPGGTPESAGYEYQILSAHIWPTSAACDCPTSYVAP